MNNNSDGAAAIARLVCGYCLNNRSLLGKPPFRELFVTDQKIENTYKFLTLVGGHKRFTESKQSALLRAHLFTPDFFQIASSNIELFCKFTDGSELYWDGRGSKKRRNLEADYRFIEESGIMSEYGFNLSPYMQYQVNIGGIWGAICHYLES